MDKKEIKEKNKNEPIEKLGLKTKLLLIIRLVISIVLILLSILLIIDSSVYNIDSSAYYNSQSINRSHELEIAIYNSEYENYVGDNRNYNNVRALIENIILHNNNVDESTKYGEIQVIFLKDGLSGEVISKEDIKNITIKSRKLYQIRVVYDTYYGYVSLVVIREQAPKDDIIDIPLDQYNDLVNSKSHRNNISSNYSPSIKIINGAENVTIVVLFVLFFAISLINTLIALIRRKYNGINLIVDMLQILIILVLSAIYIFVRGVFVRRDSVELIVLFILMIAYLFRFIMLFRKAKSTNNFENLVGSIILYLLVSMILLTIITIELGTLGYLVNVFLI